MDLQDTRPPGAGLAASSNYTVTVLQNVAVGLSAFSSSFCAHISPLLDIRRNLRPYHVVLVSNISWV